MKSHEPKREIPFELVIEILTRLPAKSLMRFKSVSKLWSSLICSQYFTNRFLKVSSSPPRLYMWLGFDNSHVLLSSSASPDSDVSTTSSFVVDQDLTIPAMEGYYVSHVFHGLTCFTNDSSAQIYNTATKQLVVLPDIEESNIIAQNPSSKRILYYIIGHDPVHDQYKVFCTVSGFMGSEHWVFILGGDVSSRWKKIPSRCPPHRPLRQGFTIINGRMHYLAWDHRLRGAVLVSFDICSEEISTLQVPEDASLPVFDVIEYGGRVALLLSSNLRSEGVMKLWVMEDAENKRWSSSRTLVLHPSQRLMFNMHLSLRVQGTTSKGEVIIVPPYTTLFYVFLYNLEKNHLRQVEIKETSNRYLNKSWDIIGLDDVENIMHL